MAADSSPSSSGSSARLHSREQHEAGGPSEPGDAQQPQADEDELEAVEEAADGLLANLCAFYSSRGAVFNVSVLRRE